MSLNNPTSFKNRHFLLVPKFSLVVGLLCLHATLFAQNIGNWTFNNTLTGIPGLHNTVGDADFSGAVPVHSFNGGTEYFGGNGWPASSINTSMYLEFSLTPSVGYQLDISSIILRVRRSNTGSPAGAGPTSWSLRSSLDGFTADIASGSMTHTYANYTVSPGAGFLQLYTTVIFRLYGYNTSVNPGGSNRLVADNITATGLSSLLPVKQIVLSAFASNNNVRLSYDVYNTEKNSQYLIERSPDGIHFSTIYTNEELDNAAEKKYTWTETVSGSALLYYRALSINSSGERFYSTVVMVKTRTTDQELTAFIRNDNLYLSGTFPAGPYKIQLYGMSGQLVQSLSMNAGAGYNSFVFGLKGKLLPSFIVHIADNRGYTRSILSLRR